MEKKAYGYVMSCQHGVGKEVNRIGDFIFGMFGVNIK
jgi:hypothetical protein